jgi:signal recognition particle receptor subunit beta
MAVYETEHDRIVLRVVYDGPGHVGKTTNVEQLALAFVGEHRPDPQDGPLAGGRTRYFDWFCFDGGKLDGHALQIQIVGVPGPKRFEARRAHLLRSADVIVLVVDSTLAAQELARETLDSQREHLGALADDIPLIVQANKQDIHLALLPHEVGQQLALPFEVPVLGAQASTGIGVRETMVQAVRAAVRRIKRQIARNGISSLKGKAGDADTLRIDLDHLAASALPEDGPPPPPRGKKKRGASRPTLVREPKAVNIRKGLIAHDHGELAQLASRDDDPDDRPPVATDPNLSHETGAKFGSDPVVADPETSAEPPFPRLKSRQTFTLSPEPDDPPLPDLSPRQSFTLSPEPDDPPLPDLSEGTAEPPPDIDHTRRPQDAPANLHALVELATALPLPRHEPEHAHELAPRRPIHEPAPRPPAELASRPSPTEPAPRLPAESPTPEVLPPLPRADVPQGHVWPIPRGREILRGLVDLAIDRLPAPPRTAHDPPLLLAVGAWRLCTRPSQRFPTLETAHAALLERVRHTRPCAGLLASDLVLVVQPEPDGGARLWHIVPRLDGIREHLALRPAQARPRVLAALAAAIVGVLRLWLRHRVALELNLSAFAVEAGRVVHLGDPLASRQTQLGTALLGFCERLSGDAAALAAFTAALEQELAQLDPDERTRLDLETALVQAETRYQDAHVARSRLLAALRG